MLTFPIFVLTHLLESLGICRLFVSVVNQDKEDPCHLCNHSTIKLWSIFLLFSVFESDLWLFYLSGLTVDHSVL